MDHEAANDQSRLFKPIFVRLKVQPSCKTLSSSVSKKFNFAQRGVFSPERLGVFRQHSNPYTVVPERLLILFLPENETDSFIHVDGVAAEHGTRPYPWREMRIEQLFQHERKR